MIWNIGLYNDGMEEIRFSEKQEALIDYILIRLGFKEGEFLNNYIKYLNDITFYLSKSNALNDYEYYRLDEKAQLYYDYNQEFRNYVKNPYSILDFFAKEYKLKRTKNYVYKNEVSNYISATDISNFYYCPVGLSIQNTFEQPKNYFTVLGDRFHRDLRLESLFKPINNQSVYGQDKSENPFLTADNKDFFDDIKHSTLLNSGHSLGKNNYFTINHLKFVGQPDYIFKNANGNKFIVEEKYKFDKFESNNLFYNNHIIQLLSYIYFLEELNADYGYLLYWYFVKNFEQYDYRCEVIKITRSFKNKSLLYDNYDLVKEFKLKKYIRLDTSAFSAKKCALCVYCILCSHKNLRRNEVTYTYQRGYHNLYPAKFPDILKHETEEENNPYH